MTEERDRLVTKLAEQTEALKTAQRDAKAKEADLLAEFETERAAWADKEAQTTACFSNIEDLVDDFFPGHSVAASQAIEAQCEERRAEGAQIAVDAPRTLNEQILSIQARLWPAHQVLFRLQRVGAQEIAALWPGLPAPCTPSRSADWLEVAADCLEAWKGSVAQAGARRALEFVMAWYPRLDLAQLDMFRLEAQEELVAVEAELVNRAAAVADFTDTSIFIPEVVEEGGEAPQEWLGLNSEDNKDSAEVIDSSDEGEEGDEEEDEDEEEEEDIDIDMSEAGADDQPHPDRASSNDPRSKAPAAAGGGQVVTDQSPVPPTDATDSVIQPSITQTGIADSSAQPEPPVAPIGAADAVVRPEPPATPTGTVDPNIQSEPSAVPTGTADPNIQPELFAVPTGTANPSAQPESSAAP
ncbi:uncharacterized protein LOC119291406 [Triticum dicoccoides]|uniref:uncharacterized protein LOC119291406 n=1 Tax=Triticum dicoccoides TaxID=85692 RepID=UPI00188FEB5C|nr:uncharacterized protein LOC119291406 [Triticum dicoccoides]